MTPATVSTHPARLRAPVTQSTSRVQAQQVSNGADDAAHGQLESDAVQDHGTPPPELPEVAAENLERLSQAIGEYVLGPPAWREHLASQLLQGCHEKPWPAPADLLRSRPRAPRCLPRARRPQTPPLGPRSRIARRMAFCLLA